MNDEIKSCPNCGNIGWYPEQRPNRNTGDAEWEQVQCEFCYTEPNSVFNVVSALRAQLAEAQAEVELVKKELEVFNDTLADNEEYCASMSQALSTAQADIKRLTAKLKLVEFNKDGYCDVCGGGGRHYANCPLDKP